MADDNKNSDDFFANMHLLADAASFVSIMENLGRFQRKRTPFARIPKPNLSESWFIIGHPKAKRSRKRKFKSVKSDKDTSDTTQKRRKKNGKVDDSNSESLPIPSPPQDVLALVHANEGSHLNFLIRKHIYESDLKPHLGRLSIPCRQVRARGFLTEGEKKMVTDKGKKGIMVSLISPRLDAPLNVSFRRWDMNSSSVYVICGTWTNVIKKKILSEGDYIQLWCFRDSTGKLCLVLIKENQNDDPATTSSRSKSQSHSVS